MRVAGVYSPALVERLMRDRGYTTKHFVSPGFTPRPWLSDSCVRDGEGRSVAGVYSPALVERGNAATITNWRTSVAGVYSPALVERDWYGIPHPPTPRVSPGFTPRPWLSVNAKAYGLADVDECRRGLLPGLG